MQGIPRDHKTPYKKLDECHECGESFKKHETLKSGLVVKLDVYDDPWATKPSTVKVHTDNDDGHGSCLDKLTDTSWADFRYFTCERCNRLIVGQCLDNSWRSYVKHTEDGEEICVKCYQAEVLENGMPAEAFDGTVRGDFFNSSDLHQAGYRVVDLFDDVFINGANPAKRVCDKARELIESGHRVVVDYERMGIGSTEGYVSLYMKGGPDEG